MFHSFSSGMFAQLKERDIFSQWENCVGLCVLAESNESTTRAGKSGQFCVLKSCCCLDARAQINYNSFTAILLGLLLLVDRVGSFALGSLPLDPVPMFTLQITHQGVWEYARSVVSRCCCLLGYLVHVSSGWLGPVKVSCCSPGPRWRVYEIVKFFSGFFLSVCSAFSLESWCEPNKKSSGFGGNWLFVKTKFTGIPSGEQGLFNLGRPENPGGSIQTILRAKQTLFSLKCLGKTSLFLLEFSLK